MKYYASFFIIVAVGAGLCSAQGDAETEAKATIFPDEGASSPHVLLDLGDVIPGKELKLKVELLNGTSSALEYDDVIAACNCSSITPTVGSIEPGKSKSFQLTFRAPDFPVGKVSGGMISFVKGSSIAFELHFRVGHGMHAGFGANMVLAEWMPGQNISIEAPVVIGDLVDLDDLSIEVRGVPGEVDWSIDRPGSVLRVVIKTGKDSLDTPIHGTVDLTNLSDGTTRNCQVIIDSVKPLMVYPNVVRFVEQENGSYKGTVYARPVALDSGTGPIIRSGVANCNGRTLKVVSDFSNASVARLYLFVSKEDLESVRPESSEKSTDSRIDLQFSYVIKPEGPEDSTNAAKEISKSITLSVPFVFQES